MGRHLETCKKFAAVLCDVKEICQHGQKECLAKTPRTSEKRHTRQAVGKKFIQKVSSVNVIVVSPDGSRQNLPLRSGPSPGTSRFLPVVTLVRLTPCCLKMPAEKKRDKHNFEPANGILTAFPFGERLNGAFSQNLQGEIP